MTRRHAKTADTDYTDPHQGLRGPVLAGVVALALGLGGLGVWSALAPLASGAHAPGQIVAAGERKQVAHPDGGRLTSLAVAPGQRVAAGEVVARLDSSRLETVVRQQRLRLAAARGRLARLRAERAEADSLTFPEELAAQAEDDGEIARLLASQRKLFDARRDAREGEAAMLAQRVEALEERRTSLAQERAAKGRELAELREAADDAAQLVERGALSESKLRERRRRVAALEAERARLGARIARTRGDLSEARQQLQQQERDRLQELGKQIEEVQATVAERREALAGARQRLDQTAIRAPVAGTVVGLQVHSDQAVIKAGEPLFEIVPSRDRPIVAARVRPQDVDRIREGQVARLRFTALAGAGADYLAGEVRHVSADRLTDSDGGGYYRAEIAVPDSAAMRFGKGALRPGLPVEVVFTGETRSLLAYLSEPLARGLDKAFLQ